jgi:hypothetical protein
MVNVFACGIDDHGFARADAFKRGATIDGLTTKVPSRRNRSRRPGSIVAVHMDRSSGVLAQHEGDAGDDANDDPLEEVNASTAMVTAKGAAASSRADTDDEQGGSAEVEADRMSRGGEAGEGDVIQQRSGEQNGQQQEGHRGPRPRTAEPPAAIFAPDRMMTAVTGRPPSSPAMTLATPWAMSSRSGGLPLKRVEPVHCLNREQASRLATTARVRAAIHTSVRAKAPQSGRGRAG